VAKGGKRPFWAHQLVEYILGGALVASGLQSPKPLVPAVMGGVLLFYAASTRGALAAFRLIDRRWHKVLDPAFIVLLLVGAVQPWVDVEVDGQFVLVGVAAVFAVVWLGSSFHEKPKKAKGATATPDGASGATSAASDRSTEMGRSAGRTAGKLAATGVNAVRKAKAKREGN